MFLDIVIMRALPIGPSGIALLCQNESVNMLVEIWASSGLHRLFAK